ncbi:MAG: hypothetical protein GX442_10185 [Candidatus Riflebacteria bacterium]|nr:hypothetical protein [Candidatus Riflebacteria bacterium]
MSDDVRYQCGHTAPRTIAYQPWHKCPDCHRAEGGSAQRNAKANLPALEGTEKQIRWAEGIRDKAYRTLSAFLGELDGVTIPELQPMLGDIRTTIGEVLRKPDSKWWIERKDVVWRDFVMHPENR